VCINGKAEWAAWGRCSGPVASGSALHDVSVERVRRGGNCMDVHVRGDRDH
jgi:hypothetical protein